MNTLKTGILLAAFGALAVGIGFYFFKGQGAVIGLIIAFAFQAFAYFNGHKMALKFAHADPLPEGRIPWLEEANRQLSERAGIQAPKLYLSPDPQPNAFAAGRDPSVAVVCFNQGLLDLMPRDQVIAVLAHEIGHVKNRDTLIMTVTAAFATLITYAAQIGMFFGRGDEDRNPMVDLLMFFLGPIAATMIQMAVSRTREFEADRTAAQLMNNPNPMIDALATLERGTHQVPSYTAQPATAHMYIASPFSGGGLMKLFMTHPPVPERIAALREFRAA